MKPARQVSKDLGIHYNTVVKWAREFTGKRYGMWLLTDEEIEEIRTRPDRREKEWRDRKVLQS